MKTFVSVLMVLSLTAAPSFAGTILQEDFNGTAGTSVADGVSGWTGDSNIVRSSDTLDAGNSATWADNSVVWPKISKGFSNAPGTGDVYTLTATLYAPTTGGADSEIAIRNSGNPATVMQGVAIAYGDMQFGVLNTADCIIIRPQPTVATDVKLVFTGTTSDFYYRSHGATDWSYAGQKTGLGWSISAYDQVAIFGHGGVAGGIDSVLLSVATVPEPTVFALLATGLISLLAYAWRKRK